MSRMDCFYSQLGYGPCTPCGVWTWLREVARIRPDYSVQTDDSSPDNASAVKQAQNSSQSRRLPSIYSVDI